MLDSQQVEIVGRNWLTAELVHAGFEAATPLRDNGVDLLVSAEDHAWTLPARLKTSRETVFQVHRKYLDRRVAVVYVLLGDKAQALPAEKDDVYRNTGNDYSARTFWLTPHEAWRPPTDAGLAQDLENHDTYRFSWAPPHVRSPRREGCAPPKPTPRHRHRSPTPTASRTAGGWGPRPEGNEY